MLTIDIKERDLKEKPAELRKGGLIPAVYYGPKQETTHITIDKKAFKKVWQEAGETAVVTLGGGKKPVDVLIHKVQRHPVSDEPIHIDFYVIQKDVEVEVEVPLDFVGVSPAVKEKGGLLVKVIHNVTVRALPSAIPQKIEISIESLDELDSTTALKDLTLPSGVTIVGDTDETVAAISVAKEEEEDVSAEFDAEAIEVEKKGKEETPEDAAAEKDA